MPTQTISTSDVDSESYVPSSHNFDKRDSVPTLAESESAEMLTSKQRKQNADIEDALSAETGLASKSEEKQVSALPLRAKPERKQLSKIRCLWLCCTWSVTWCVPPGATILCIKQHERRIAWREKLALNVIIYFMCGMVLFFIVGLGYILCPKEQVLSSGEISSRNTISKPYVYMYGTYYAVPDMVQNHITNYGTSKALWEAQLLGSDISQMFPKDAEFAKYCPDFAQPNIYQLFPSLSSCIRENVCYLHSANPTKKISTFLDQFPQYAKGTVVWADESVSNFLKEGSCNRIVRAYDAIYDVSSFYCGSYGQTKENFFGAVVQNIFEKAGGNTGSKSDFTSDFEAFRRSDAAAWSSTMKCMNNLLRVGKVDHRNDLKCQIPNYILLASSVIMVCVIGFKFASALQFGWNSVPEEHDKFVICQVPCYTEGESSLRRTIESLANLEYEDRHKLLFIICDGMITGTGNDRPTPQIVLDILGIDETVDPEAKEFQSLGDGSKQLNFGKVYSGLYEISGRYVPYIVVVKVGHPKEQQKPGNRGKRDSQMILMRFLSRVHFNQAMSPLELTLYHHLKNIIGVNPNFYEYVFMVDADTEVYPDSLNRLVSAMTRDSRIMGICGETHIANEKDSWVTMVQVYEYFISHQMAKAFESLFGSVTCLPGCFCMYRIKTHQKNVPLLIAPGVISDYSENTVDTLHLKNLLHLGEDRYLTTLMLKHFPHMRTCFTPEAKCMTYAPDKWSVLLSQRRRWINSTVHNLVELLFLPELCGFCLFSMRFVVFLDLFATLVQPAALLYVAYLVFMLITDETTNFPLISVIMLGAIYGFQIIIFLLRREWQHIGWMVIYLLATPVHGFWLPLYSFWHFDDFSWGNTRRVVGEDSKARIENGDHDTDEFDHSSIPLQRWSEYEQDVIESGTASAASGSTTSRSSKRASYHSVSSYASLNNAIGNPTTAAAPASPYMGAVSPYVGGGSPYIGGGSPFLGAAYPPPESSVYSASGYAAAAYSGSTTALGSTGYVPVSTTVHGVPTWATTASRPSSMSGAEYAPVVTIPMSTLTTAPLQPQSRRTSSYAADPSANPRRISSYGDLSANPRRVSSYGELAPNNPRRSAHIDSSKRTSSYADVNRTSFVEGSKRISYMESVGGAGIVQGLQQQPSDEEIMEAVISILASRDLMTVTKRMVREELGEKFGVDMTSRKDFVHWCIDFVLKRG
ncbi:putative chitin synthase 6 [Cladochytrium replicatum]|nr:putative chitin synthase 6 [Cladochytrium replicatum]